MPRDVTVGASVDISPVPDGETVVRAQGFGITTTGAAYFDPVAVDVGDQADLYFSAAGSPSLRSRSRRDPVVPDYTLVRPRITL